MAQTRLKRWIFATDSHGDQIDKATEKEFLAFCKHWKPDVRIHGGDFMDLRALRRGASDEEKNEGVRADIERGVGFVRAAGFQVLMWGNHDYRLVRAVRDGCGRLREHAIVFHNGLLDEIGEKVQHVPYHKRKGVYRHGDITFIHGYHTGIYAARQAAATYGPGKVVMGHIHSKSSFVMPTLRPCEGHSIAAMCNLDMDYNIAHANTLRQSNGWAYGVTNNQGESLIWHAERNGNRWILPSEFKAA